MNYQIRRGDTLSALAVRFGTTVSALARANGIANVNLIYAGASLQIPGHSTRDTFEPAKTQGVRGGAGGGSAGLAEAARKVALSMGGYNSQGLCATGVSRALLANLGIKVWGNGNQIDDNLPRDRFRQVNMSLEEALRTPGLILTWEKTGTAAGSIYGHTAITAGDGHTSYSDFIERYTSNSGRTGLKVFAPI
jgi:LysM repeat protein